MVLCLDRPKNLRVAIVGGGISGLGAAISLLRVPNVDVQVYERATELKPIGGGLNIGLHTRTVLDKLGVAYHFNGKNLHPWDHRKGVDGKLLYTQTALSSSPKEQHLRVRRSDLHNTLLRAVPPGVLHLSSTLKSIQDDECGTHINGRHRKRVCLGFSSGIRESFDLVIGADGLRSRVRDFAFPSASIKYTGVNAYRATLSMSTLRDVGSWDATKATSWYLPALHVFYTPFHHGTADGDQCELVLRTVTDVKSMTATEYEQLNPVSWGVDVSNEAVEELFKDFEPAVQQLLRCVPTGGWKNYAGFAGPKLSTMVTNGNVVLVGDAAHPMSGAFGSGATFGLEDGWALGNALHRMQSCSSARFLENALVVFDTMRSPHYHRLYRCLDELWDVNREMMKTGWEAAWVNMAKWFYGERVEWIYSVDLDKEFNMALEKSSDL